LVDAARPESEVARRFAVMVDEYLALAASSGADSPAAASVATQLRAQLIDWRDNHELLVPVARASAMLPEAEVLSVQLRTAAETALAALDDIESGRRPSAAEQASRADALGVAEQQHGALQVMVVAPIRRLVAAAAAAASVAMELHATGEATR
jgi:hypothetical protein